MESLLPRDVPFDRFNIVYLLNMLLGAGMLWPYNTLVGVPDFLKEVYQSDSVEYEVPMFLNYPALVMLVLMVRWGDRFSFSVRIIASFCVTALILAFVPLITLDMFHIAISESKLIFLTLVFVCGINTAIMQSSIFGFASLLPPEYTQAVMAGNGVAGLIVSALRIISKASFPDNKIGTRHSAIIFFIVGALFTLLCAIVYVFAARHPFTKYHIGTQSRKTDLHEVEEKKDETLPLTSPNLLIQSPFHFRESISRPISYDGAQDVGAISFLEIIKKVSYIGSVTTLIFVLTFMVFPGLITSMSSTSGIHDEWFALYLIVIFNAADLIGRFAPSWYIACESETLWIPTLLRFLLYPLFVMRARQYLLTSDLWCYALIIIIGFSNGYFASLSMMAGPTYVNAHEREASGYVMTVFLMAGILIGSHLATLLLQIHVT